MTVIVSPIWLTDVANNIAQKAELWDAVTEKNLIDWELEWVPELLAATQRLHQANIERRLWPQSRHWDWRRKADVFKRMLGNSGFSIVCSEVTQGMMFVDTSSSRCRIASQKGLDLVYVEFLENAPWNRRELLFNPPRYRGIGTVLIRAAIELSKAEGFKGRIGLHSLPQANNFYANTCGMEDLGIDDTHEDLRYFEMTPECAEAFVAKGTSQ